MSSSGLTKKQKEILDFIRAYTSQYNYSPSIRDVCEGTGLKSTSSVSAHLDNLEMKGYIKRDLYKPRCMQLTEKALAPEMEADVKVPLYEKPNKEAVASGHADTFVTAPDELVKDQKTFAVKMPDEMLTGIGIYPGDTLICIPMARLKDGDIALCTFGSMTIVAEYRRQGTASVLFSRNEKIPSLLMKRSDGIEIIGKVIGVIRVLE